MRWRTAVLVSLALVCGRGALCAQAPENATLRQALQAYDALDFTRAGALARRALTERMTGADQARAYELLGFTYSATDSQAKAVDAFKQAILIDPDRQLDATRISPKITSLFYSALGQVLVVRQVQIDSARFVAGQGAVPIRFTVTSPARVRVRADQRSHHAADRFVGRDGGGEPALARPVAERRSGAGRRMADRGRGDRGPEHLLRVAGSSRFPTVPWTR